MIDERKIRHLEAKVDAWRFRIKDADDRKTYAEVFDRATLLRIAKMISDHILDTIDYPVSTGKEGNVFHATGPDGALAVKIYRINMATYRSLSQYILGDPRFKNIRPSHKNMVFAWAQKEYKNLARMGEAGVRVPRPVAQRDNLLVMEYIGDEETPARVLRTVPVEDPAALYEDIRANLRAIHRSRLVHGDFSEYNMLWWKGRVVVIDVGQSVPLDHPRAEEWYRRDLANAVRYVRRLGVDADPEELDAYIRGDA